MTENGNTTLLSGGLSAGASTSNENEAKICESADINVKASIELNTKALKSEAFLSKQDSTEDVDAAPIEMLSEFLSAVMARNYPEALKCCEIILHYEPGNKIVQEFYPLIQQRLRHSEENVEESDSEDSSDEGETNLDGDEVEVTKSISSGSSDSEYENEDTNSTNGGSSGDGDGWATALNTDSDGTEKDEVEHDSNSNPCQIHNLFPTLDSTDVCDNKLHNLTL